MGRKGQTMKSSRRWLARWERRFPEFIVQMEKISKTVPVDKSIYELRLSVRAQNLLIAHGIRTTGELMEKDPYELLFVKNLGVKTVKEIMKKLSDSAQYLKGKERK